MGSVVEFERVSKAFAGKSALNDLSFEVPSQSIYGFIGPNGSGKTTTLRVMLHLLRPDTGQVEVLGDRGWRAANDRIGYLPEERGLYRKMTVGRQLAYFGRLKGVGGSALRAGIDTWLERMELGDWKGKKIETLSKGMVQKLQFIVSVLNQPYLLILDEPFSGLDPVNLEVIRDAILELRSAGTTVILSTHDMAIAERLCDRVMMIFKGDKVLDGSLESIRNQFRENTVKVHFEGGNQLQDLRLSGVDSCRIQGNYAEFQVSGDTQVMLRELAERARILHFEVSRPSLHDIFVSIVRSAGQCPESAHEKGL